MTPAHLLLMMAVCLTWAVNIVLGKTVLSELGVPPLFYAGLRFLLCALLLLPLLRERPQPFGRLALIGLLMGAVQFALMFSGLRLVSVTMASLLLELAVPLTVVLSAVLLGERLTPRRICGCLLTCLGAVLIIYRPGSSGALTGVLLLLGAACCTALVSIMVRSGPGFRPLQFQAWSSALSAPPLLLLSGLTETGQIPAALAGGTMFWGALAFSVIAVTLWAQSRYLRLMQLYDASLVAVLSLAMPVMAILISIWFLAETVGLREISGIALSLAGIFIVQTRPNPLR